MIPTDQLAQLAAAAYRQTSAVNRIQPPANWTLLRSEPEDQQTSGNFLGFSASAYRGPGGQVVIAFTGTNDWADWPTERRRPHRLYRCCVSGPEQRAL